MKMKAAVLRAKGDARIVEIDKPECGPRDVIVKTVRSGICGSDVSALGVEPGAEFGHETAGWLTEVGSEVAGLAPGQRVFVQPMTACPVGRSCMMGGFSEYIRVPGARLDWNVYLLPDGMSYDVAALIEPFAVGTHGKNVPGAKPGDHVVVYGVGTIGLSCISALIAQGIKPVAIVRNDKKRALLEKMGATVCNISEADEFAFLRENFGVTTHRVGYPAIDVDIVVDCAGAPTIVDDFLKMMKRASRLSIVGVNMAPVSVPLSRIMSAEVIIQGASAYDDADIREVIDNLASGRTHMEELITHHYKLDDIQEALATAADRTKAIKVIVDME
ncbi:MAG: zinc-binding dehydrogenase [Clostridiales Family XIII bacterium]|jgi:2-desacetyl-2-hydroxyethyl bacteriochlorophyllide A dehydrogenase|nr:zinc-binding dehydrogenase [Clostridiales Family XIII bacterium]